VVYPFHVRCVLREEFFEFRDDLLGDRTQLAHVISWGLLLLLFRWLDAIPCRSPIRTLENVKAAYSAIVIKLFIIRARSDIPLAFL